MQARSEVGGPRYGTRIPAPGRSSAAGIILSVGVIIISFQVSSLPGWLTLKTVSVRRCLSIVSQ